MTSIFATLTCIRNVSLNTFYIICENSENFISSVVFVYVIPGNTSITIFELQDIFRLLKTTQHRTGYHLIFISLKRIEQYILSRQPIFASSKGGAFGEFICDTDLSSFEWDPWSRKTDSYVYLGHWKSLLNSIYSYFLRSLFLELITHTFCADVTETEQ